MTTNHPQAFRMRRIQGIIHEELVRAGPDAALGRRNAQARILADPVLKEAMLLAALEAEVEQELRRQGAVQAADGTWGLPKPPVVPTP